MDQHHLNENSKAKTTLRVVGPIILGIGILCIVIAGIDFFSAVSGFGMPRLFFLFFIGMPITAVGGAMTSYGYMGTVARYTASQVAPVAKDVTNYMVDGTKQSIKTVATVFADAIHGEGKEKICPHCGDKLNLEAKFCDHCGKPLVKICSKCNAKNDSDARYCQNCGERL